MAINVGGEKWTLSYLFRIASAGLWWLRRVCPRVDMPNAAKRSLAWNVACWRQRVKYNKRISKKTKC